MPGLVWLGRRWAIGSDDLFLPSISLFIFHLVWISATIAAVAIDFDALVPKKEQKGCSVFGLELMCSILVLLIFASVLELCLTIMSLRGSILNDIPRSGIPHLLTTRLISLILELLWSVFAILWSQKFYFTCHLVLAKQVMIGLIAWIWFVLLSVITTAWCVYDVAGRSWVKMKRYQANLKEIESRHPSFRRSGSTARNWRQRKVLRAYESSWNNRCRLLFCCMYNNSDTSRDSFGDLAKLLSEFFRDLDVVPSDIIVGLLLLRKLQRLEQCSIINEKRNNTYEFLSGIAITPNTKFVAMNDAQDLEAYRNVVHYMRYASAAYGWLWYVIPNGFQGLINLCSNVKCCFHRYLCNTLGNELSDVVVEDNCCFCNVAVIPTMFDPSSFDIVYATYHVDVCETPFFVVVDYEKKAIVVSIRGTLSLKDLMTDLNAEAEPLPLDPVKEDWLGHKGMVQVATYLKSKLIEEHILDKAFEMCQSRSNETFNIVIVGHSLGGGAAAILAILLREKFPTLVCYAYSPPGGLLSMPAVEYTKQFVTSVIVGKDLVPRIGLSQMEALRADLINAIKKSHTPKWQTIMSRVACCKCMSSDEFPSNDGSGSPSGPNETSSASQRSMQDDLLSPDDSMVSMTMHRPLYPPGRIMHIVRHHPKKDEIKYESVWRRIIGKGEPVFQAIWTENTDYDEVLISPGMIQDHMPDNVLKALNRVTTSFGPAKPQRLLTNNPSPVNLGQEQLDHSSQVKSSPEHSQKTLQQPNPTKEPDVTLHENILQMTSPTTATTMNGYPGLPNCPAILEAVPDAIDEECDDYISVAGSRSTETLFSLKISWEYFRELGKHPCLTKSSHTRTSSSGSSNYSELGTTMKELFGPSRLYECTVPLASSETLSEISSMSSRASFNIMRDRSPLTKLKLAKNLSLRVHENGSLASDIFNSLGKSHQRSYSCVYPEGKRAELLINPYGTLNGGTHSDRQSTTNGHGQSPVAQQQHKLELQERLETLDLETLRNAAVDEGTVSPTPSSGSTTAARKQAGCSEEVSHTQSDLIEDPGVCLETTQNPGKPKEIIDPTYPEPGYSPVYPVFSVMQEYGLPRHVSSHYHYGSGQTPTTGSTSSAQCDED